MGYKLEGRLLEVCNCNAICPCWVGEDPSNGTCDGLLAWHFESGNIDGVDVSGLTIGALAHIPGNALEGNWKIAVYVDEKASDEQHEAILDVYTGKQGGPVADLMGLIGEVVSVEKAPIDFSVDKGKGTFSVGSGISGEMVGFQGPTGAPTYLTDAAFSDIPGDPYYVGKAPYFKANNAALGVNMEVQGKSAVQGNFSFESA